MSQLLCERKENAVFIDTIQHFSEGPYYFLHLGTTDFSMKNIVNSIQITLNDSAIILCLKDSIKVPISNE